MEIEIFVYLGIVVIIGTLVVVFAKNWDFLDQKEVLDGYYFDEKTGQEFKKISPERFAEEAYDYWNNCNYSTMGYEVKFYVYPEGNITAIDKPYIFQFYKALNWCSSIMSKNLTCGWREDVNMTSIALPEIIKLSCINATLYVFS